MGSYVSSDENLSDDERRRQKWDPIFAERAEKAEAARQAGEGLSQEADETDDGTQVGGSKAKADQPDATPKKAAPPAGGGRGRGSDT